MGGPYSVLFCKTQRCAANEGTTSIALFGLCRRGSCAWISCQEILNGCLPWSGQRTPVGGGTTLGCNVCMRTPLWEACAHARLAVREFRPAVVVSTDRARIARSDRVLRDAVPLLRACFASSGHAPTLFVRPFSPPLPASCRISATASGSLGWRRSAPSSWCRPSPYLRRPRRWRRRLLWVSSLRP